MRSEFPRVVSAVVWLVAGAQAQNVTLPASLQGVEGGGATNIPFGSNQACRYQCIYDAEELPWTGPRAITGLSIRADNGSPALAGAAIAGKGFVELSVLVSTTHRRAATASGTFEENYGEDAMWVMSHDRIMLPAQPVVPVGPRPANVDLVFTTPWYYGLTPARNNQPAPTNLLVEVWIHSQPSGAYRIDNLGACQAVTGTFGNGLQCLVPAVAPNPPAPVSLTTDVSMQAGSPFGWHVAGAPANAPFLLAINGTNQGSFFGTPLPFPLFDPQNPSLPAPALAQVLRWPAPDCWLNIDPTTTFFGACDAAGQGTTTLNLPAGRQFVGLTFYGQAIVLAPSANQLGMVTSLGRHSTICGPLGVARIYAFYNGTANPPPLPPATGAVQYGIGMVLEVR